MPSGVEYFAITFSVKTRERASNFFCRRWLGDRVENMFDDLVDGGDGSGRSGAGVFCGEGVR